MISKIEFLCLCINIHSNTISNVCVMEQKDFIHIKNTDTYKRYREYKNSLIQYQEYVEITTEKIKQIYNVDIT